MNFYTENFFRSKKTERVADVIKVGDTDRLCHIPSNLWDIRNFLILREIKFCNNNDGVIYSIMDEENIWKIKEFDWIVWNEEEGVKILSESEFWDEFRICKKMTKYEIINE